MIENPKIGDRVSYADMANPYKVGTVTDHQNGQWLVVFDSEQGSYPAWDWSDLKQHGWKLIEQTPAEAREALSKVDWAEIASDFLHSAANQEAAWDQYENVPVEDWS